MPTPKRSRRATQVYEAIPASQDHKRRKNRDKMVENEDDEELEDLSPLKPPEDNAKTSRLAPGRGVAIKNIPSARKAVEKQFKKDAAALRLASVLLLGTISGKTKVLTVDELLNFSGYLPAIKAGVSAKAILEQDKEIEITMSKRAFRFNKPDLLRLVNLFGIKLSEEYDVNKDNLVDVVCRFTASPDPIHCGDPPVKAEYEPLPVHDGSGSSKKHNGPTQTQVIHWARAYVRCFNMSKATLEHAIATCSDKFGFDMMSRKNELRRAITEEL